MNSEMEKRWSWGGAARGAAQGAVTGGFSGLTGGPAGAAVGAGLGAVGGAIAGGTGWGRQLEEAEKRDLSGNFNVNGGWNQQTGANINAGLSFSWKETETLEKRLLDEVFSFTNNALNELVKRGISKLGDKAAAYVETFSDDLRAVAAGVRTLAQQAGSQNREKLSINDIARRASFSWRKLIDRAQGVVESTPALQRWSQALVAPVERPETREKILTALAGAALAGAKSTALGAVKSAAINAVGSGV